MKFDQVHFLKSVVDLEHLADFKTNRGVLLPEIAVVGRSNVGKSSLFNHLFQVKGLVKTSSTPGKTRAVNFFSVDDQWIFADLPGYGYAKVSHEEKEKWRTMMETYLSSRMGLRLLLLLLDIRRTPSEEDLQMLEWIRFHRLPCIVVLTKVDKVKEQEKRQQILLIAKSVDPFPYVAYSVVKDIGRNQLIAEMRKVLIE